jgi:hypothetical protein
MSARDSLAKFGADRAELIGGAEPSSSYDLLGMQMDFDAYWFGSEALDNVQVISTGDPDNLLDVTATARPGIGDDEVVDELVRIWTENLRYGYAEAHVVTRGPEGVTLRAVTKIGPQGFYVTATVTVARA